MMSEGFLDKSNSHSKEHAYVRCSEKYTHIALCYTIVYCHQPYSQEQHIDKIYDHGANGVSREKPLAGLPIHGDDAKQQKTAARYLTSLLILCISFPPFPHMFMGIIPHIQMSRPIQSGRVAITQNAKNLPPYPIMWGGMIYIMLYWLQKIIMCTSIDIRRSQLRLNNNDDISYFRKKVQKK